MKKIKAVIFDLDGTLANTLPLCIAAFRSSVEPLVKRPVSDEEIIATFGPSEEGTIMALAPDFYEQGVRDYLHYYDSFHHLCPVAFEGVEELLALLQKSGVRLAMVTGKGHLSTAISLKKFELTHFFDAIETGSPSGPRKAEGILSVLEQWGKIEKEEVVYVGDAPSDIEASRRAGVQVVAAAWAPTASPGPLLELEPGELFYSIADFKQWLLDRI
jgi:phosphoglycolate phosphatase-like HAD superfamily hydrolase